MCVCRHAYCYLFHQLTKEINSTQQMSGVFHFCLFLCLYVIVVLFLVVVFVFVFDFYWVFCWGELFSFFYFIVITLFCSTVFVNAHIKQPIIVYFHHYNKARSELSTDVWQFGKLLLAWSRVCCLALNRPLSLKSLCMHNGLAHAICWKWGGGGGGNMSAGF